ncbi:MAG: histidinol-phosphate transaminase [Verrucomicrobiota bacterium]
MKKTSSFLRPLVQTLHAYVPGEQPKIAGLVKLNTNENPYPPSPKVLKAVKAAVDNRLRLYPNPFAQALREKLAALHGCSPDQIIVGNGSDELLALATRAFVEPARKAVREPKATVQYFNPSYSLYPVLADIHGAHRNPVALNPDFSLPSTQQLRVGKQWQFDAALTFVTTPNAPSGRGYATAELEPLCQAQRGIVILDEAYVDFAPDNAMALALKYSHVIVSRTFSKAYSLCFQRVGYFVGHAEIIAGLHKVRDSYNVNGLGQAAAVATLEDLPYYRGNFQRIVDTRDWLGATLAIYGFKVLPSQTNFILARPPKFPAKEWLTRLRDQKVLVRWFDYPEVRDYLRITIGTQVEARSLVKAAKTIIG